MMSGRVNGVLAVTRSLGDSAMKDFVVGAPYTTETELCDEDEFMIIACDGVRIPHGFPCLVPASHELMCPIGSCGISLQTSTRCIKSAELTMLRPLHSSSSIMRSAKGARTT
jgi:hypothetical protein